MRMTLQTDYALRMLIYLAIHDRRLSTVNDVAESYGISRNHLLKIALRLRNMGLLSTARGRSGGIRLAMTPDKINVGTVVRNLGDDFPIVECMKADAGRCVLSPTCRLKGVIRDALGSYLSVFDKFTLADLVANRSQLAVVLDAHKLAGDPAGQAA
ncbi:Rrf2 family transcriptional regulator [Mesorhizobium sp. Root695]|jgi:Rrf2 family nitric oxide-sensitive transcriptional repressor|uniref:RrF2 family transcriptional regulator n=1 Tax=unclassified Mesorhizobium TaxID=325217 RepID=UPI0006FBABD1|nr:MULTISPECIES: Rrf2 family transcriptional regulator [unclassified Mesorhizobium]KQU87449.1 Rrf2 family transcriptional regulator [Mesorhizobium sp. Root102]KRB34480.1 Rrf2 family transcriptional regulator [Mesorhizobium sp. Root695]